MRCAVLGDPIAHSLSPTLHRAAYAGLGLGGTWTYDAVRVPAGGLADLLAGLDGSWRGLSLTMPLKREVVPLLAAAGAEVDDWVGLTGAANTLVLDGGVRRGLNTDVTGALRCLREVGVEPRHAVVLGGGATATSVLVALAELGLATAAVVVRDPARAAETLGAVARHPRAPRVEAVGFDDLAQVARGADVLVSTVPVTAQSPAVVAAVATVPVVFDVVYDPWPTPVAAAAGRDGRRLVSGLDLLVAQAVDQVRAMTGRTDVPVDAMRAAAERELAARTRADDG